MKALLSKRIGIIKFSYFIIIICICLIGILFGSFFDLEISKAIASDTNFFGKFFDSFGEFFGYGMAPIAGSIFLKALTRKENKTYQKVLGILLFITITAIASYFMGSNFSGQAGYSWKFSKIIGILCTFILYVGLGIGAYFLIDKSIDSKKLVKNGLIIFLCLLIPVLFTNFVLKGLAYRPRYRAMVWDNATNGTLAFGLENYKDWWEFSFYKKPEWFLALGYDSDLIKSWPSGHSACAATTLTLPYFINSTKFKGDKNETIAFIAASIYAFLVGFMRILRGAHFLSDISFGILITTLLIMLITFIMSKIMKE